jgi:putative component of toxin-antitoxin plasmid stabilization module
MESVGMRNFLNRRHLIIMVCCAGAMIGAIDQKTKNALKVQHVLRTIERHASRSGEKDLSAKVTQSELNDYIAYRLVRERQSPVKKLKVELLENNHVQGSLKLDARQLNLGLFFGNILNFDFSGALQTKAGAGRLVLAAARMNGQPIEPQTLDLVLQSLSAYYGTQMGRIGDWYKLPKGVKRVRVHRGWASLVY